MSHRIRLQVKGARQYLQVLGNNETSESLDAWLQTLGCEVGHEDIYDFEFTDLEGFMTALIQHLRDKDFNIFDLTPNWVDEVPWTVLRLTQVYETSYLSEIQQVMDYLRPYIEYDGTSKIVGYKLKDNVTLTYSAW